MKQISKLPFKAVIAALAVSTFIASGCGDKKSGIDPDRPFGQTAMVVVVNPVVNEGNTANVPSCYDDDLPSSNATLLHNHGMAPLDSPPPELCP